MPDSDACIPFMGASYSRRMHAGRADDPSALERGLMDESHMPERSTTRNSGAKGWRFAGPLYLWAALACSCDRALHAQPGQATIVPLTKKYSGSRNVLRGAGEVLRQDALEAPLPQYPSELARGGRQGLVVVELVVVPSGRMQEHLIHESFHPLAGEAVVETLRRWRFRTNDQLAVLAGGQKCPECIRISRLAFDFVIRDGKPLVIDLADEENRRKGLPKPSESASDPGKAMRRSGSSMDAPSIRK